MNRIVVYSGGFDSLCLLYDLMEDKQDEDTVSLLYFNYGQKNVKEELRVVNKVANKFNIELNVIELPKFNWSESSLVSGNNDVFNQYVPMRNVIFLSYALSLAESKGANEIYFAFINPGGEEYYTDTSPEFIQWANEFSLKQGISVVAPFIDDTKIQLVNYIGDYNISKDDFFSCNVPKEDGTPCNICGDCLQINELYNLNGYKQVINILSDYDFDFTCPEVKEHLYSLDIPITSAKLFINNSCNAKCEHCYLDHLSKKADLDVLECIDILASKGIDDIDFFGKEVLVDKNIFTYTEYLRNKYPHINYTMITNGLNLEKYKSEVIEYFKSVTISLEDFNPISRPLPNGLEETIKDLVSKGVDIQISLDLLKSNYTGVISTIKKLETLGVSSVYVKPIFKIGRTDETLLINAEELTSMLNKLAELNSKLNLDIVFEMKQPHLLMLDKETYKELTESIKENEEFIYRDMALDLEFFCNRYFGCVTISPYGHILGCGYESALPYETQSKMGHITNFDESVKDGKRKHCFQKNNCKNSCYFI